MTGRRTILFAALVALLQIGFLAWMIQGRASILQNGREVLLRVEPVDPRDFLRGDYVRLGYEASRVPAAIVTNLSGELGSTPYGAPVTVRLSKQADGHWLPVSATLGSEISAPAGGDQVDVRATVSGDSFDNESKRSLFVDYGIERFYVPEGEGIAIETDMRVRPFAILAAIDDDGTPQIKGLMDGDKMLFEEPLY